MKRQEVLPVALEQYLKSHSDTDTIHLHLDNDEVGRTASDGIRKRLEEKYRILDEPPACGKDVNDQLMIRLGLKEPPSVCPERPR